MSMYTDFRDEAQQPLSASVWQTLDYCYRYSPYYRSLFDSLGLRPESFHTLADLRKIPTTGKAAVARDYRQFQCVPDRLIVDRCCTSGTSGAPVPFLLTDSDLNRLADNEAYALSIAGVKATDIVQLCTTMDQRFMAGLAYFLGLRKIGAGVIRQGVGTIAGQWETILREEPTVLIGVPSFMVKMLDFARANGIDYRATTLRKMVCIGERLRDPGWGLNALGKRIRQQWPELTLHSTYASTEMGAAFTECEQGQGGHHNPDLLLVEVLDAAGQPVANGQPGELTITTLGVEAMPLIRFRTGDIVTLYDQPCACGRTTLRVGPVLGRLNQMLKVRGTTIYLPAVQDVVHSIPEVAGYVIEACQNDTGQDHLRIHYTTDTAISNTVGRKLADYCRARLRLRPELTMRTATELREMQFPNGNRKPRLFIDNRIKG
jgi:phenylacetate-CoA ligase